MTSENEEKHFESYEEAFDFLEGKLVVFVPSDDTENEEMTQINIQTTLDIIQSACEWADQSGRGIRQ